MTAVIDVKAPPEVPSSDISGLPLLPVAMAVVAVGATAAVFFIGSPVAHHPAVLTAPAMMVASLALTIGRGRRRGAAISGDRREYLEYLRGLRAEVAEVVRAQHASLTSEHPEPGSLWTLIGDPRMWTRQSADPESWCVRVGVGSAPLCPSLQVAPMPRRCDPLTVAALNRFVRTHSTLRNAPVVMSLHKGEPVTVDGDVSQVRGLLRAMVCQLAIAHPPGQLLIVGAVADLAEWDWLKWLPHNRHPDATDLTGPARLVYPTLTAAREALAVIASPHAVIIADTSGSDAVAIANATVIRAGGNGAVVVIRRPGGQDVLDEPDYLDRQDAVVCARRIASYAGSAAEPPDADAWPGADAVTRSQCPRDRLCVPIGATPDGRPVRLDIKESALHGIGPHGLCVGATGSGKSELLRTVAVGMMARNSPEVLNLLLIDFKGGATFLDLAGAPHVAAVVTNLADEAPLVARMREALAGEMNRRQQFLRTAGHVSAAEYQRARGPGSLPLPTLFIIVDEFAELLSQHPDFADTFVAIGRLGRSLGVHLLLASQRLDEGRLRGLEAHLSYRVCLKTLSAVESRAVLGTADAYELPSAPGAGLLRTPAGDLIRFQAASVSGPAPGGGSSAAPEVRPFTAEPVGAVRRPDPRRSPSILQTILAGLEHQGPPAHQVWLPPLDAAPALEALLASRAPTPLVVPIGAVDRPYQQCRPPLTVDLSGAAGNVAVVGAPRSGKSTALCTLITALTATHGPGQVQFYCLDFGGGALFALRDMPHVGAVADRAQPELVRRTVAEMESVVHMREACLRAGETIDSFPDVFLVVDGWAGLRLDFDGVADSITVLAAQGLSYKVHVMVAATRWAELRPAFKDQLGTRIELRLGDPADSEFDRRQSRQVPTDRPGRGLCVDGLHMTIALPAWEGPGRRSDGPAAPPIPLLPSRVEYDAVVGEREAGIVLGLEERQLRTATVDFTQQPHLLMLGDNGCGKTAALRTLCREIVRTRSAAQARLFVVDFRRTLLGVVPSEHLGGYAGSPGALGVLMPGLVGLLHARMPGADVSQAQLRDRSWWTGPEIYLMVDDYDLVTASAGNPLLALLEYLPYAADLGLHMIVARRSGGAARALFEPLLASLRELGCMGMMMSGRAEEGALLGSKPPVPLPPGRGTLITRPGVEQLVQVAWSPPE
ncbi:type VII secretion protein EccCb [Mycobacterium sp. TY814]|uniref:type VII secretion protein EccCb n=1 Tax=unclassified Mycobacterium TaxID=2642494 RepID=UPI002741DCE3|nr:type VII secretion protein EccCb [Mycobacterium sp. TY814]MDP7722272.1 type VII secretion protein EccCb [Mycobacterium sp. TY814]